MARHRQSAPRNEHRKLRRANRAADNFRLRKDRRTGLEAGVLLLMVTRYVGARPSLRRRGLVIVRVDFLA